MKMNKGITLIALVITIVVLIILAGVVISLSLGENGIFNKAKYATETYSNEQAKEETEIAVLTNSVDLYSNRSESDTGKNNVKYTVLFEGNENGIKTKETATASLSEDFNNYDILLFTVRWDSVVSNIGYSQHSIDTDSLKEAVLTENSMNHFFIPMFGTAYLGVDFDTDFKKFWISCGAYVNSGRSPDGITKVVGIKFN